MHVYIIYVTGPVLSTQNTPIHIMVSISFSVCAIQSFIEFLRNVRIEIFVKVLCWKKSC